MSIPIDDKFMNFSAGWIVELFDGSIIYEGEMRWEKVPKTQIKSLSLKWHDKMWAISGKDSYIQCKRGYVVFSQGEITDTSPVLSDRCIGYYDSNGKKVVYRVCEATGAMKVLVNP